jgi:benzoate 4-monooxygenase
LHKKRKKEESKKEKERMAIIDLLLSPYTIPIAVLLFYIVPYLTSNTSLKSIPGPFFAKFTNLWLLAQARQGKRYQTVDDAHKKYGKLVRIQPDHVSIADENAIPIVYGHGNGFLKSYVLPLNSH